MVTEIEEGIPFTLAASTFRSGSGSLTEESGIVVSVPDRGKLRVQARRRCWKTRDRRIGSQDVNIMCSADLLVFRFFSHFSKLPNISGSGRGVGGGGGGGGLILFFVVSFSGY